MTRGVNKAVIIGTVGRDPEKRCTSNGNTVVNVSVATNDYWKDSQTGEAMEHTEWHRIVLFGRLGEVASEFLTRGSRAYFEGRIFTSKWQDKDGIDRYSTEVIASQMEMLDGRRLSPS